MMDRKHKLSSVSSECSVLSTDSNSYSPPDDLHSGYRSMPANNRIKRLRANDRERRRVHLINCAMESLRDAIPGLKDKKKLTKLELLRAANQYIWLLDESLRTGQTLDEVLNTPEQPQIIYYVGYGPMPVLKREQSD